MQREAMNKGIKESSKKTKMEKINKYKQYQKEREEAAKKIEDNHNSEIINKIEKIKALRENNKNIGINRRKTLNKDYNDINEKKYENNVEKTKELKKQIEQLQSEEDAILAKLNKTRDRYNNYTSSDKFGNMSYSNRNRKHSHKNSSIKTNPFDEK